MKPVEEELLILTRLEKKSWVQSGQIYELIVSGNFVICIPCVYRNPQTSFCFVVYF